MNTFAKPRFRLGSIGIVVLLLGLLTLWMASGMIGGHEPDADAAVTPAAAAAAPKAAFTVQARRQTAEAVQRLIQANGDTRPDQVVNIASQVEGQVTDVGPRKGARVREGQLLVSVDVRDLDAQKTEARALVRTRELDTPRRRSCARLAM